MSELVRPPVVLVTRCVIEHNGDLLLLRRSVANNHHPGLWEFPGGKVEAGQSVWSAQEREILEESGLRVRIPSPLAYVDSFVIEEGRYAGLTYVGLFSIAQLIQVEDRFKVRSSGEHDAFVWEPYQAAMQRQLTPESRRALHFLGATLLATEL